MTSIGRLPEKERRKVRRLNHVVKDLRTPKYKQQVIPSRKHNNNWEDNDDYEY